MNILESGINLVQSHRDYKTIIIVCDLNFLSFQWENKIVKIFPEISKQ